MGSLYGPCAAESEKKVRRYTDEDSTVVRTVLRRSSKKRAAGTNLRLGGGELGCRNLAKPCRDEAVTTENVLIRQRDKLTVIVCV